MKVFIIRPKEYLGEKFIVKYIDYSKREAIKRYKERFPQFTMKELTIE